MTANANGAVLTSTRIVSYPLSNTALSGGGWQTTALLETDGEDASSPRVMFDAAGNGFAAWTQDSDTIVRRYTGSTATWSAPVILDTRTEQAHQARLAIDRSSGDAIVSWTQSDGTAESVYVSRFSASTSTWSAPQLVESDNSAVSAAPENSSLSFTGQHAAVAWLQADGAVNSIYLSRLVSGVWTAPALVDVSAQQALHPEVAIDVNGNAMLVWRQRDINAEFRIHTRRWDNATQSFGAVTQLDDGGDRQPRIYFDAQGNAFALWRGDGVFARRFDATSGQWEPGVIVHNQTGGAWGGELSVDQFGNAMAVWLESDGTAVSVYTRRYDVGTAAWGAAVLVEDSDDPAHIDYNPTVSIVGGEAIVAWLQTSGGSRDVYAARLSGGTWTQARLLDIRPEATDELTSTVDAAGNAAVLWVQPDGSFPSVYQALYLSSNFPVTSGATWQSIANTLYGVNSVAAGNALQTAMGGGTLTPGTFLSGLPAMLNVVTTVPAYYTVQATDTWSHIAQTVYGTNDVNAIAQLQSLLGNPTLTAGLELVVPASIEYIESDSFSAPLNWALVNTTTTSYYQLNQAALTIPLSDWSIPQLLESDSTEVSSPRVAFDADGNGIAVWAQDSDIIVSRYIPSSAAWSAAIVLDTNMEEAHQPRLAIDRVSGDATVSWSQSDGAAESLYVSSFDASANSWTAALPLENSNNPVAVSSEYSSASRGGEHAAIAWVQSDGVVDNVYLSRLVSGTWSVPALIDVSADPALQPEVAIDLNGNVTVVWRQRDGGGDFRIQARRWDNTVQAYGSIMELDGDGDRYPRIAFDAQGNGFALWRGDGVFARRFDVTAGLWEPQVQIHNGPGSAVNGEIAVDEAGNALVTWVESDGAVNSVYARYYDAATATWGTATLLENNSDPASIDHNPTVSLVDGSGVVAWIHENGASLDVYVARMSNGTWGSATLLDARVEPATELSSSIDASDNATVLWVQPDGAAPSIYAARSNSTPYYLVPANATWQSIANALYGINTAIAGDALETAMSNPTLTAGMHLAPVPATLTVMPAVPTYYVVQSGDTWSSITLALYGTSNAAAVTALQTALGNPALTTGTWLTTPSTLDYSVPAGGGG